MKVQKITVKALIIKDKKALFVQDQKGSWELPGGCIEFGEKPIEALRREIREELGIFDLDVDGVIDVFDIQQVQHDGNEYHYIVVVYRCTANLSNLKLSEEHRDLAWIDKKGIMGYEMKEGYRKVIGKV